MTPRKSPVKKRGSSKKKAVRRIVKKSVAKKRPVKRSSKKKTTKRSVKKAPKRSLKRKTTTKAKKRVAKKTKKKATKRSNARKKTPVTKKRKVVKKTKKKITSKKAVKKTAKKPANRSTKKTPEKKVSPAPAQTKIAIPSAQAPSVPKKIRYPVIEWAGNDNIDRTLKVLKDLVRKKSITGWRINYAHTRSANVYLGIDGAEENCLDGMRDDLTITAYAQEGRSVGQVEIPIISTTEKQIRDEITAALALCDHVRKPAYDLPAPCKVDFPQSADKNMIASFKEGNGMRIAQELATQIREGTAAQDVTLNNAEVFTSVSAQRVLNSRGVDVSWHASEIYIETTLTAAHDGQEQEFHWSTTAASPRQIDLPSQLEQQAIIVKDAARAVPCEGFEGDVLLSQQSLLDFFAPDFQENPLLLHASAKLRLMGLSRFTQGEHIGEFTGEPFSISSNPSLALGTRSAPVDREGTALTPTEIIQTGVFVNHLATARYAGQLGIPRTGELANIHISDGATREEHLRGLNYVEIVQFSWFNPDPFSGDFSAEIRLGYHWKYGKRTPFRGGQFVGNVFEGMRNCRLSREAMQSGRYYGPRALLFKDAVVTKRA